MSDWKMHGKPALLILHMQSGMKDHHAKVLEETGIIARQQALLKAFRSKKLPVIYVNAQPLPSGGGVPNKPAYGRAWEKHEFIRDNPEDLKVISELAPQAAEAVLFNWPFGAFNNSGLEQTLTLYGVDTLVPVGFSSYGIVASVIEEARNRYYATIVPKDASAALSAWAHNIFMEVIASAFALVTTTDDVIAHL